MAYRKSYYSRDPRWLTARFPSTCKECGETVRKGQKAFYFPATKAIFCRTCGQPHSARFEAERFDEDMMNSSF